ncbi:hypothetical protein ACFCXA_03360 [Streptomyces virginiae]|uniref:hypothetical protein n=1 Tax=Streptomyces virginiae TaxID=1961 RepID=UPI003252D827
MTEHDLLESAPVRLEPGLGVGAHVDESAAADVLDRIGQSAFTASAKATAADALTSSIR